MKQPGAGRGDVRLGLLADCWQVWIAQDCATDGGCLHPGLGALLESFIGHLAAEAALGSVVVGEVLPPGPPVVDELGSSITTPPAAGRTPRRRGDGALHLALRPRGARLAGVVADAPVQQVIGNRHWNSAPLSVWMTSTQNGSRSSTESANGMALCWLSWGRGPARAGGAVVDGGALVVLAQGDERARCPRWGGVGTDPGAVGAVPEPVQARLVIALAPLVEHPAADAV